MDGRTMAAVLGAVAAAGLPAAAAGQPAAPVVVLTVQVLATEDGLSVTEVMEAAAGAGPVRWTLPLLVPEDGPGPALEARSDANPDGIEVRGAGGASVSVGPAGVTATGQAGRGFKVQARYTLKGLPGDARFRLDAAQAVDRVQVTTRRTAAYGLQVRPLVPYGYREDVDEEGTWQTMVPFGGLRAGSTLRVGATHLPAGFARYRAAALGLAILAAAALAASLVLRRRAGA